MSRNLKATRNTKIARVRRDAALARPEMLQPSAPRVPAAGITSMAVKVQDPEISKDDRRRDEEARRWRRLNPANSVVPVIHR